MGLLTNSDAAMFQHWFKEMVLLRGISVKYMYPLAESMTIHSEIQSQFSEPVDIDCIFDDNPKIATLKRIGWVSENADDKPYIVSLPIDTPHLQTKCRIMIPPVGQALPGRWFEVTSIHVNLEYPDCYVCTLAPVFEKAEPYKTNNDQTNYNYIAHDRANQPNEDQPANYPANANFKFLGNFKG